MKVTGKGIELRKSLVPLRLFSTPDTGGLLNRATHFYYYEGGMPDRDKKRGAQVSLGPSIRFSGILPYTVGV